MLWETGPRVDDEGNITGMPVKRFLWRLGIPLRADRTYRVTVIYDNPTAETIPSGAMGVLGGAIVPVLGARWPPVDRSDPVYVLDRQYVMNGGRPRDEHHDHGDHSQHSPASSSFEQPLPRMEARP